MKEMLMRLYQLQMIDNRINELFQKQKDLPEQVVTLQKLLQRREEELAIKKRQLQEVQKKRRSAEQDLEENNEKIKKYQAQLFQVKTNKEYTAILHEIELGKKKSSAIEDIILLAMEEIDKLLKEEKILEFQLAKEREEIKTERGKIEKAIVKIEEDLAIEKDRRRNLTVRLSKDLLSLYERVAKGRDGIAVVNIKEGCCGGCYISLPPQRIQEIKKMDLLITCEHCGRILLEVKETNGYAI
ncbi:MAG: C4-type zinc ribbon domain-containing protein [Candidatus Edwardsbacteria bacterium]